LRFAGIRRRSYLNSRRTVKSSRQSVGLAPMLAKLHTFSLLGIDALPVKVAVLAGGHNNALRNSTSEPGLRNVLMVGPFTPPGLNLCHVATYESRFASCNLF
jgi:hypothetical protein